MEEQSQRVEDAWSEEDLCSDEEIDEQGTANLLHDYITWLDIYSVIGFLRQRRKDMGLQRTNAGAWCTANDLKSFEVFEEKALNTLSKKRKG